MLLGRAGSLNPSLLTVLFGGACERARADGAHEETVVVGVLGFRRGIKAAGAVVSSFP